MAKYKWLGDEPASVDIGGRLVQVQPGGVLEFPADWPNYIQTGEHGEPALFDAVELGSKKTTAKSEEK